MIELNWTDSKLPVIKVVESSDFTNEKRQFLSLSVWETHLLWAPLGGPQWFASILCIEANFLLFAAYLLITIVLEWMNFFFSLWPFYTQLLYTFAPCLTNPAWDHADPHCSSNSKLLESCLKLAEHNDSPFCAFSQNAPSFWNVLPSTLSISHAELILIYHLDSGRWVS